MAAQTKPAVPRDAKASGRRLWRAIVARYELEAHETQLLVELVRVVDRLDELNRIVRDEGLMVSSPKLGARVHPAAVEARQLAIVQARLTGRVADAGRGQRAAAAASWDAWCVSVAEAGVRRRAGRYDEARARAGYRAEAALVLNDYRRRLGVRPVDVRADLLALSAEDRAFVERVATGDVFGAAAEGMRARFGLYNREWDDEPGPLSAVE